MRICAALLAMNLALIFALVFSSAPAIAQTNPQGVAQNIATTNQPRLEYEGPVGGWNYSATEQPSSRITYAYPTPPVDRGGQYNRSLIRGRIMGDLQQAQDKRAARLIVNGNVMPLYTDEQGRFARPWAFGAGSNSIEIKSSSGTILKRSQFLEANSGKAAARLRIVITWDDPQAEVDLHVLTPDGQHAYWAAPVLNGGGGFDVDSVDGAGPEIFSSIAPVPGSYSLFVNYWGNFGSSGYHFDESTRQQAIITTRITIIWNENSAAERRESRVVPLRKIGDLMAVKTFVLGAR
jgi:uncharacterized protein YfaP (DUF2135 family)